ncbi:MAG: hypothetical protein OHK0032_02680 [Thermodesulfovibrionales bacterium]
MSDQPKKMTFQEVIETSLPFYNDERLEEKFDSFIKGRIAEIIEHRKNKAIIGVTADSLITFLRDEPNGLLRILGKLYLSEEKFKRIITLLRKLEGIFDREWSIKRINKEIKINDSFARKIANIFINGRNDHVLKKHLPRFYRERLNLETLAEHLEEDELKIKLKDKYMGTYSNWKGDLVEGLIKAELEKIENKYGISYAAGKTSIVDVTVDWAIPNLEDPYVLIMSSYQETTSSGQSTKTRDMLICYEKITHRNIHYQENRAFVNFVDGGGWLARQKDLRRLVDGCHYFLNIKTLSMLEAIVLVHVPKKYFRKSLK